MASLWCQAGAELPRPAALRAQPSSARSTIDTRPSVLPQVRVPGQEARDAHRLPGLQGGVSCSGRNAAAAGMPRRRAGGSGGRGEAERRLVCVDLAARLRGGAGRAAALRGVPREGAAAAAPARHTTHRLQQAGLGWGERWGGPL